MEVEEAKNILIDEKANIALRMDAVFTLKSINTVEAIYALSSGFESKSNLLTHEIAYVLGQMQNTAAVPVLQRVLCDNKYAPITRHEVSL